MAYNPNHISQDMALQPHFSDTDNNNSFFRTILPEHQHLSSAGKEHWLNSAILRQQGRFAGNSDSATGNNQWLSRSILQRNVNDVNGDDGVAQNDSIVAVNSPDLNNRSRNVTAGQTEILHS
ncbi:hypothetical protein L1987_09295 [Smallanthus sonchifolius]|uniref:Uncharacterized protein n=1 Tax=Smallanthus sonchifolius TaxID=185202 RepID=A0ACB9JMJ7_9ASTR|nr:hypothetical protein L1987_09295 [Smallanthus sonchifolius]